MYLETLQIVLIKKIDPSPFVQKPYLRTTYIEADIEADIDLKNQ